jgi:hypothetical protein
MHQLIAQVLWRDLFRVYVMFYRIHQLAILDVFACLLFHDVHEISIQKEHCRGDHNRQSML